MIIPRFLVRNRDIQARKIKVDYMYILVDQISPSKYVLCFYHFLINYHEEIILLLSVTESHRVRNNQTHHPPTKIIKEKTLAVLVRDYFNVDKVEWRVDGRAKPI